ncbi:MAG: CCA tRNA nucleotidyltransferase [Thermoplasmata archaeon]
MVGTEDPSALEATRHRLEAGVRQRITPSAETFERVARARTDLVAAAETEARRQEIPLVRAVVAGSAARGTFLSDRLDIDLFLLFPPGLARSDLEKHGLRLGRALFEEVETRYAEHPYLRGRFGGFAVDAVPGYAITDPAHPQSAVDRTPFHHRYLTERLTPALIDEIRLAKQFLRSLGIYGSEARTQGFSGYAVELLLLRHGSLGELLRTALSWHAPVRIVFTEGSNPRVPEELPLIMDDPVDPARNVTSALSRRNFATLLLAARAYLADPRPVFFETLLPPRLPRAAALERVALRGTHVVGVVLPRPPLVDDILYPQITKAARATAEEARRLGFAVLGSSSAAGPASVTWLLEVASPLLPFAQPREGPPPGADRSDSFLEKWGGPDAPVLQGPFVTEEGRLAVESRREVRRIEPLLTALLPQISLGRDLARLKGPGISVQSLEALAEGEELPLALGELLDKRLPWDRTLP